MTSEELRNKQLTDLADYLGQSYHRNNAILLEDMVSYEGITLYYDSYEREFDGMLVFDEGQFHIHIDNDGGNEQGSRKGRFTLAHELAHYFIDEHRLGLKRNEFPPHGTRFDLDEQDPREIEANLFAGALIMPTPLFRSFRTPRKFSIDTIFQLADRFGTSFLSTAIRFCEAGNHPIFLVFSQLGRVKWFKRSSSFPAWPLNFRVGQPIPSHTVAGDYFRNPALKYTSLEEVDPARWFRPNWHVNSRFFEQCYYSKTYGYVISFLWFE